MVHDWRKAEPGLDRGRMGEIALRIAFITACANRDREVTEAGLRCALEFCEWQEQIRAKYQAGVALTLDAKCMEAVLNVFEQLEGKTVKFSDLAKKKHWYKKYGTVLSRVRDNLIKDKILVEDGEEAFDPNGKSKGFRKNGKIFMPVENISNSAKLEAKVKESA
jgi:hypothetical protein